MVTLTSERLVDAPIGALWAATVDIERWPDITPTVVSVERLDAEPIGLGSTARLRQPAQRPAIWTVDEFEPEVAFSWSSKVMGVTMRGRHLLNSADGDQTLQRLEIVMSGRGSGLMGRLAGRQIQKAIDTENEAFAEFVQRR